MRRIAVVMVLLIITTLSHVETARGQMLYKCVSANGTSYQQIPCPRSARLVHSIETVPELPPTAAQLAEQALKAQRDREESAFLSRRAGTDQVRSSYRPGYHSTNARSTRNRSKGERYSSRARPQSNTEDACAAAKIRRDNALRSAGLNRTFDLLRQLDAAVSDACKRG